MINDTIARVEEEAKERGLKRYSTMGIGDLQLLLAGKRVPKKLCKNQVSVGTQTDFPPCNACRLEALATHLSFKAKQRKIIYDGDLEFDAEIGELLGCDYEKIFIMHNKMDFADECCKFMILVWGVIVVVAPIVAIYSWLKTQKMGRKIEQLEERDLSNGIARTMRTYSRTSSKSA